MKNTVYKSVCVLRKPISLYLAETSMKKKHYFFLIPHVWKNYASNALVHVRGENEEGLGLDPNLAVKIINQCYDITPNSLPPPCRRPSTHRPSLYFALRSVVPRCAHICIPVRTYHLVLAMYPNLMPTVRICALEAAVKEQEERARLLSIQTKREQWKAASARYYEKHPEVKERKRVIMAEKRAAKKLARRRCDPPKQPKPTPNVGLNTASAAALASAPSSENEIMLAHEEASAAESLLFLQQSTKWNPFPPDLPDSDDPGTSTNSEASSPGR
ncbi:hypothetical protein B0H13DRAFT_1927520 [Mycena leptocephala]|nr:hypothetical protein B0H13DRAFT_1927520 [Mycena leptocephala]